MRAGFGISDTGIRWISACRQHNRRYETHEEANTKVLARQIKAAYRARDFEKLDQIACAAYGLDELPEFDFVDLRGQI